MAQLNQYQVSSFSTMPNHPEISRHSTKHGLDWTGQLDWTVGLDNWTGQLDWTIGLDFEWDFFH